MSNSPNLAEAILDLELRHTRFYNGRLLTGRDLQVEQEALHAHLRQLGTAVGAGVSRGLEVVPVLNLPLDQPAVTISSGVAVNLSGQALRLAGDTRLALRPPALENRPECVFTDCEEQGSGVVVPGRPGFFVLTIGPASALSKERSPVSGEETDAITCDWRDVFEGVQFRLFRLKALADASPYPIVEACFGLTPQAPGEWWPAVGAPPVPYGLETLLPPGFPLMTDVPLALLEWNATGLALPRMWPVRRRITRPGTTTRWSYLASERRVSEGEAFFLDFQEELDRRAAKGDNLATLPAQGNFALLPPAGVLPPAVDWKVFLGPLAPPDVTPADKALLPRRLRDSFTEEPIHVPQSGENAPLSALLVYEVPQSAERLFIRSPLGRIRVFNPKNAPTVFNFAILQLRDGTWRVQAIDGKWPLVFDHVPGGSALLWFTEFHLNFSSDQVLQLRALEREAESSEQEVRVATQTEERAIDSIRSKVKDAQDAVTMQERRVLSVEMTEPGSVQGALDIALANASEAAKIANDAFSKANEAREQAEELRARIERLKAEPHPEFSKRRITFEDLDRISLEDIAKLVASLRLKPNQPLLVVEGRVTDVNLPPPEKDPDLNPQPKRIRRRAPR